MRRTLVTGFGPFQGVEENPSETLARGCGRAFQVLEVAYAAADTFIEHLDPASFDNLLMLGVATGRDRICFEMLAQNFRAGQDVVGQEANGPIDPEGPDQLPATLWKPHLCEPLIAAHPQSLELSHDAGRYLCNYLSYQALQRIENKRVGFLHVTSADKMPLSTQAKILRAVLEAIEA